MSEIAVATGLHRRIVRLGLVLALSILAALGAINVAHSQGLFDLLRGILRGRPPAPQHLLPPFPFGDFRGEPGELRGEDGGPHVAYCVRLCDGRYFPLPAGSQQSGPENTCSAMCPAAQTKVFSGGGISRAVAVDGRPYTSLQNAFIYRERLVPDCTCTGKDTTGVAQIDVQSDPTLRPGDIVVTKDGPVVFKGDRRSQRGADAFVPVEQDKQIPQRLRQTLSQIQIASPQERANVQSDTTTPPRRRAAGSLLQDESMMRGFNPPN
jgi:hypothetical protein